MELLTLLLGYVAKQHGITEDAAAELLFKKSEDGKSIDKTALKDTALTALLSKDKERVTALKTSAEDKTETYNRAYAEAKKEILPKVEKKLAEKYGIEGKDFKIESLVEQIVAKQAEAAVKGDKPLDEDSVKKHPIYLKLEKARQEELEALKSANETALQELKDGYARKETLGEVKTEVLTIFDGLKPVLSKDPARAGNQRSMFAKIFDGFNYQKQESGDFLVLDQEGKRIEDGHGNPVSLKSLVSNKAAEYYDFQAQDKKESAGNGGDGSSSSSFTVPTSKDDYTAAVLAASSPEERMQITDAYEAAGGKL